MFVGRGLSTVSTDLFGSSLGWFWVCLAPAVYPRQDRESWPLRAFFLFFLYSSLRYEGGPRSGPPGIVFFILDEGCPYRKARHVTRRKDRRRFDKTQIPIFTERSDAGGGLDCYVIDVMNGYKLCTELLGPGREYKMQVDTDYLEGKRMGGALLVGQGFEIEALD